MAALSNYVTGALLNALYRGTAYSSPATVYIALLTTNAVATDTGTTIGNGTGTGVEVTGGSYARLAVTANTSNFSAPSLGSSNNTGTLAFITSTGSWGTITGFAICDAATLGNILHFGALSVNKTVTSGDTFEFTATNLTLSLS